MAIIRYKQKEIEYCIITGRMFNVKLTQSEESSRTNFTIAYNYSLDDFDNLVNDKMYCVAWNDLAIFVKSIPYKTSVMAVGKIKQYTWNGETREEFVCDFVIPQPSQKKSKKYNSDLMDCPV